MMSNINIKSEVDGTVWKVLVSAGDKVAAGMQLIIVESMKMEIPVMLDDDGIVKELHVKEGDAVSAGDVLAVISLS